MDKKTWQKYWDFSDEDMRVIELAFDIMGGKLVKKNETKLTYDKIKYTMDFCKKLRNNA